MMLDFPPPQSPNTPTVTGKTVGSVITERIRLACTSKPREVDFRFVVLPHMNARELSLHSILLKDYKSMKVYGIQFTLQYFT